MSDSVRPHRGQPTRLLCPWDSPGKNTGVGCHFLLQCMKVKSESEVALSCPTLSDPMDWSLRGSSIHGIFQARVLEWGAIAFSEPLTCLHINSGNIVNYWAWTTQCYRWTVGDLKKNCVCAHVILFLSDIIYTLVVRTYKHKKRWSTQSPNTHNKCQEWNNHNFWGGKGGRNDRRDQLEPDIEWWI